MFDGILTIRPGCEACGLDLTKSDTGDGPAFFVTLVGGFAVLLPGVCVQVAFDPPYWVYVPIVAAGSIFCVALLRLTKGLLAALQYANEAEQVRFEPSS